MTGLFDSQIWGETFCPAPLRAVFDEKTTVACWLEFEKALSLSQADLGMIPRDAADAIAAIPADAIDIGAIGKTTAVVGRPIVGLVAEMVRLAPAAAKDWVHYGSTTQDVFDSGSMLQIRDAIGIVSAQVDGIFERLSGLEERGQTAVMIGRTNAQHAQPITFGLKAGVWRSEFERHVIRLREARARVLQVQFGGAVGTIASMGDKRFELRQAVAGRLGLGWTHPHWQNARDNVAELVLVLGLVATSVNKIGRELNRLASTDIGEVEEAAVEGAGRSSAMPHKRNSRSSEFADAIGGMARRAALGAYDMCLHEHERSGGAWIGEWRIVPDVFCLTGAALGALDRLLENLVLHEDRMLENVSATHGAVLSERIVMALAPHIGKSAARSLVESSLKQAVRENASLVDILASEPNVSGLFTEAQWQQIADPAGYT